MNNSALKIINRETNKIRRCVNLYDKIMRDLISKDLQKRESDDNNGQTE